MGQITSLAQAAFRNYVVDGVPASGINDPSKSDIIALFTEVDGEIAKVSSAPTAHSVRLATTAPLPTNTYANGSSGVGATLTAAAPGVLTVDGKTVRLNDRVLVNNEVTSANNGLYYCSQAGSVSFPYILTRAVDADSPADLDSIQVFITGGSTAGGNIGTTYSLPLIAANITVGTTALAFSQVDVPAVAPVTTVSSRIGTVTTAQLLQDIFLGQVISEATVASAATPNLTGVTTPKVVISGTTTITGFTVKNHSVYLLRFSGVMTLTYNATSLILPGGNNIITQPGDTAVMTTDGSGNCRFRDYIRAGAPIDIAQGNVLVNGDFQIWQENSLYTPTSGTTTFIADRWKYRCANAGRTISQQPGFSGAPYCLRGQRNSTVNSTNPSKYCQQVETINVSGLQGKSVVFSLDARSGADYSGGAVVGHIYTGTGVDESFDMNGLAFTTGNVDSGAILSFTPTGTAGKFYSSAYTIPSNATELAIVITQTYSGTAATNDYMEMTNCKLEVGLVPTPYQYPHITDVLTRCRRQYWSTFNQGTAPGNNVGVGTGEYTAPAPRAGINPETLGSIRFPVAMRVPPSVSLFNTSNASNQVYDLTAATNCSLSAVGNISDSACEITCTGSSSTVVGNRLTVHAVFDARL